MVHISSIAPTQEEQLEVLPTAATELTDVKVSNPTSFAGQVRTSSSVSKFDPKLFRQAQNVRMDESAVASRKIQTVIPVRKPSKKQFVSVHPSFDYRADHMPTIQDEATGEIYLLAAHLDFPADIENKIDFLNLAAAITTEGSVFLWHYKNSTNSWSDSARIAIREASHRWVRVIPDKSSNGYILETPMCAPPPPTWPELSFTEMLETAFGSRYIDSLAHPLLKKLRGDF
jgi:hypothetical protein